MIEEGAKTITTTTTTELLCCGQKKKKNNNNNDSMASSSSSSSSSSQVNLLDLAASAVAASVAASRPIRDYSDPQQDQHVRTKQDGSVVTDADFVAQGIIVRALLGFGIRVVGEESPEEMQHHMQEELHKEETESLLRLAQTEIHNRYHGIIPKQHPLAETTPDLQKQQQHPQEDPPSSTTKQENQDNQESRDSAESDKQEDEQQQESSSSTTPASGEQQEESRDTLESSKQAEQEESMTQEVPKKDLPEFMVDASRVSVFVDPLDGTKSYAKGEYDSVTTLIAIILDNVPTFGVITKPFGYHGHSSILDTGCVAIYGGHLLGGVFVAGGEACVSSQMEQRRPRAVISASRSEGIVGDFCTYLAEMGVVHPDPIYVSGAGEKSLRLVLGDKDETLWFFPKAGTCRWDVAASDALLRAMGGKVTDKFGQELDYSTSRETSQNSNGIIASNNARLHAECIRYFKEGKWHER